MESYALIVKTAWAALMHGTWGQVGEVIILGIGLLLVDKLCTIIRYGVYLLIFIDIVVAMVYLCQPRKRRRAIICIIVLIFIIALYYYLSQKG
ncbi:hypothetical protein SELR_pSRC300030 (plasmid) [Selenomonas ruminantium subsp. lactilytica TAM6421]|uniref:Uncharacterized protein n=1 Tax=Selenomonas ruminantium subsp. lactilytica (strain NBRC 103574 / TAM6421) TaxID=927704 RepID=I0GWD9_SELRL|nr:hypothetical protein SELR_pSRC300030 [Selenomonas ruminantium subsp. lactilytica TAM6421]